MAEQQLASEVVEKSAFLVIVALTVLFAGAGFVVIYM